MLGETGVGGQEQRGAAVAVAKVDGATLGEEEVEDRDGGGGGRQMLAGTISNKWWQEQQHPLTIGVFPE